MNVTSDTLTAHLIDLVRGVQRQLGYDDLVDNPAACFADVLDSMGLVELVAILASECQVKGSAIEECVNRRFGTIADLAAALQRAGLRPRSEACAAPDRSPGAAGAGPVCWLSATAVCLPETIQPAVVINEILGRPAGWFEEHAGIQSRRVWAGLDPLTAAAGAAAACLQEAELAPQEIGGLLVTSEAPPQLAGMAAALHHRLALRPGAVALEIGGACTGFLAALWTAQSLLVRTGPILIVAVEAPTQFLKLQPGPQGEAAALFGDGAAAALLCKHPIGRDPVPLGGVILGVDGSAGDLLRVERSPPGSVEVCMDGPALAGRAVTAMANGVRLISARYDLGVSHLAAVVCHGGNGRLPALLARRLGVAPERVWSETPRTGNLGSASLPAAWAAHRPGSHGPVVWTAVGAGLMWGAAITGVDWD
jgi:3-oxoacyl-[acyl-carrier-protein] synthase-3